MRRAINNEYEARSTKRGHRTTQLLRRICLCGHPILSLISVIVTLSSFLSTSAPPAHEHEHEHEHEHNDKGTPAKHLFWTSIGRVPLCFGVSNRLPALCTCEETGHKHSKIKQVGRWKRKATQTTTSLPTVSCRLTRVTPPGGVSKDKRAARAMLARSLTRIFG